MTNPIASHPIAASQNEEANDETSCFQHSKALRYSVPTPDHEPKQIMNPIASSPPSVHFDGFALALAYMLGPRPSPAFVQLCLCIAQTQMQVI